ncbi:response regulator [Taibaiella soli]|uniref:Response regulatory domain-containing protein n=1 Tax=Taibaiella soli TaxID=1649169 RepID=A0A2W2ACD4_9BACT|nr:response regulator [Taibaiella soli]PZF71282.1 hypothetical protein DN068_18460 [Taibaiella soli]
MIKHILFVDDDADEFVFYLGALKALGTEYVATLAPGGQEALSGIVQAAPDIIFVDYNMPKMNGIECIAALKKLLVKSIPMILVSTGMSPRLQDEGKAAGALACIAKPSSVEAFKNMLDHYLKMFA